MEDGLKQGAAGKLSLAATVGAGLRKPTVLLDSEGRQIHGASGDLDRRLPGRRLEHAGSIAVAGLHDLQVKIKVSAACHQQCWP